MSAVKLVLNPALRVHSDGNTVTLLSERERVELPLSCLPLVRRLQEPTDIDDIAEGDRPHLKQLGELRLLHSSSFGGLPRATAAYWSAQGYPPNFTRAQLDMTIEFMGAAAARYKSLFAAQHPDCAVADSQGQLRVFITEDLLDCDLPATAPTPIVLMKVGGIKQSIGPVLSPAFGYPELVKKIARPFDADLSCEIPAGLQATADHLLLTELYHLRVRAAAHKAANHVVEWDLSSLTKKIWKVKQW